MKSKVRKKALDYRARRHRNQREKHRHNRAVAQTPRIAAASMAPKVAPGGEIARCAKTQASIAASDEKWRAIMAKAGAQAAASAWRKENGNGRRTESENNGQRRGLGRGVFRTAWRKSMKNHIDKRYDGACLRKSSGEGEENRQKPKASARRESGENMAKYQQPPYHRPRRRAAGAKSSPAAK